LKSTDIHNTGDITREDMLSLLQSVYKNAYNTNDLLPVLNLDKFVEITFTNLDSHNSGKIHFSDFKKAVILEPRLVECFLMELPSVKRDSKMPFNLTDEFTPTNQTLIGPSWQPDEEAIYCPLCSQPFVYPFKRKHHCRNCGKVICSRCSSNSLSLPSLGYDIPVRVCDKCHKWTLAHPQRSSLPSEKPVQLP